MGGDFYDVFQIVEGDWVVVLGDVCGKGVEAAVITSLVRHTVRALAVSARSSGDVLPQLNTVLLSSDSDRFCSLVILRLRRTEHGWKVTSSSGGHPLPLLLRPGTPVVPVGEPGMIVGAFENAHFSETTMFLGEGESLFHYTDGVTEAGRAGDFFGERGLIEALAAPATTPSSSTRCSTESSSSSRTCRATTSRCSPSAPPDTVTQATLHDTTGSTNQAQRHRDGRNSSGGPRARSRCPRCR